MILISFLGKGNYQEVIYFLPNDMKEFKTKFFVHALNEFYNPQKTIIFMTDEAARKYESEMRTFISFDKVKIMEGKNEEELWNIFETLAESIPTDDEIIIDVTHGFRSIPIVALSVITFLKILNNIKITKVLYGAFEAKDTYGGKAPIFDITNFLDLINWSYAIDEFIHFGNAKRLRNILELIHNETYKQDSVIKSKSLKSLGKNLDELTTALSVIRPNEVFKSAKELPKLIKNVKDDIEKLAKVKPLGKLLDKIQSEYNLISEAEGNLFDDKGFKAQAQMINFYIKIEKYQQAITLTREALVSYLCIKEKLNPLSKSDREQSEKMLNEWLDLSRKNIELDEKASLFSKIWSDLITYRNDINHAGMRENPIPASTLIANIKEICEKVAHLIQNNLVFSVFLVVQKFLNA
ncbi:TIGR02221 family CRISPR-associated protein [Rosettibacter firmus]|uniref:TIGR02221 family CRISPR-associated protein n=1 Tax=Rosettibacter firmus TaxID=3111522 RepID=UPI00336BED3E